jgi:hypothetical protein
MVNAQWGAGIGSGVSEHDGTSLVRNLTVVNSTVSARGSDYGSGIGSSRGSSTGASVVENLSIVGSSIVAIGSSSGSGIGAEFARENGTSMVNCLTIVDSNVIAVGSSADYAIGAGRSMEMGKAFLRELRLKGTVLLVTTSGQHAAINATSVILDHSSVTVTTNTLRAFENPPAVTESSDLIVVYTTNSLSPVEQVPQMAALEIGHLNLPADGQWHLAMASLNTSWAKSVTFDSVSFRCLFLSVAQPGQYRLYASADSGYLAPGEGP